MITLTAAPSRRTRLLACALLVIALLLLSIPMVLNLQHSFQGRAPVLQMMLALPIIMLLVVGPVLLWHSPADQWLLLGVSFGTAPLVLGIQFSFGGFTDQRQRAALLIGIAALVAVRAFLIWQLNRTERSGLNWLLCGVAVAVTLLTLGSVLLQQVLHPCADRFDFDQVCTSAELRDLDILTAVGRGQQLVGSFFVFLIMQPRRTTPAMYILGLQRFLVEPLVAELAQLNGRVISLQPTFSDSTAALPTAVHAAIMATLVAAGYTVSEAQPGAPTLTISAVQWGRQLPGRRGRLPVVTVSLSGPRAGSYVVESRDYQLSPRWGRWRALTPPASTSAQQ